MKTYSAHNGCSTVGKAYDNFTASFDAAEISTMHPKYGPQPFNFADLPCGPATQVGREPYQPQIIPPSRIFSLMDPTAYGDCIQESSWPDPPSALVRADHVDKPHVHTSKHD